MYKLLFIETGEYLYSRIDDNYRIYSFDETREYRGPFTHIVFSSKKQVKEFLASGNAIIKINNQYICLDDEQNSIELVEVPDV